MLVLDSVLKYLISEIPIAEQSNRDCPQLFHENAALLDQTTLISVTHMKGYLDASIDQRDSITRRMETTQ
jgi:hypothetical protein